MTVTNNGQTEVLRGCASKFVFSSAPVLSTVGLSLYVLEEYRAVGKHPLSSVDWQPLAIYMTYTP